MSLRPYIVFVTLLMALLAGCSDLQTRKHDDTQIDNSAPPPAPRIVNVDDEKPIKIKTTDAARAADAKVEKGSGVLLNEKAARLPPPGSALSSGEGSITFNFENQPIQAVVQAILGALLKENYTIAPNVTGNVTFSTSRPISP